MYLLLITYISTWHFVAYIQTVYTAPYRISNKGNINFISVFVQQCIWFHQCTGRLMALILFHFNNNLQKQYIHCYKLLYSTVADCLSLLRPIKMKPKDISGHQRLRFNKKVWLYHADILQNHLKAIFSALCVLLQFWKERQGSQRHSRGFQFTANSERPIIDSVLSYQFYKWRTRTVESS